MMKDKVAEFDSEKAEEIAEIRPNPPAFVVSTFFALKFKKYLKPYLNAIYFSQSVH